MGYSTPGLPVPHHLLEFAQVHVQPMMPSNPLILCHSLLLSSVFPSIRVFSNESALHVKWPKYWSFSFSIIPSKEIPGLISFRMDWLDLLADIYLFIHWEVSALKKKVTFKEILDVVVVQLISCVWLFATPWTVARQASLSFSISQGLLRLMSIELVMPSNHLILLLSPSSLALSCFRYQGLLSQLLVSGIQSIGATASASVLPMNIHGWFPLGLTGLISLLSKSLLQHCKDIRTLSMIQVQVLELKFYLKSNLLESWT